jgi:glycosyltransferase involved in cell wall biosynthesis
MAQSKSPKRLLILGKFPFPRGSAASGRIRNIANGFLTNGWDVDVVTFGEHEQFEFESGSRINHQLIHPLPKGRMWPAQWALFIAPSLVARDLPAICKKQKYDAVYVYGRAASIHFPLFRALKQIGLPIVNDINESPEHFYGLGGRLSPNYWNGWFGYHRVACRADLIVGISEEICRYYNQKNVATYCMPSVETFEGKTPEFPRWDRHRGPEILYMGAMFERDRPDWMLRILGILAQQGAPFKLNLIGGYSKRPSALKLLEEVMAEYPMLEGRVVQYGRVSDDELQRLMSDSAFCFVLRRDHIAERCSFPTRLVECLKAGRCVISSNVPDVPNYLTHGENSILLGQESLERDADVLREFFDDSLRTQKLAEAGRNQAENVFCAKQHTARLIERIASL